jgi:hypothetical protein
MSHNTIYAGRRDEKRWKDVTGGFRGLGHSKSKSFSRAFVQVCVGGVSLDVPWLDLPHADSVSVQMDHTSSLKRRLYLTDMASDR